MARCVSLKTLVSALDAEFSFYQGQDESVNGLQVKGKAQVQKGVVACDGAMETIQNAAFVNADFLFVHHGLLWKKQDPRTVKATNRRVQAASKAGLSVYAMHLPLDAHPTLGNNALLAKAIGVKNPRPCVDVECGLLALCGVLNVGRDALVQRVNEKLGFARLFAFGPQIVSRVAVCSGSGAFAALEAEKEGFDALVVGEVKHSDYHFAKESGVNLIECGHYNSEILGPKAVGKWVRKQFGVPFEFIDAPTGL
ncbi:Nif3-like dinuclear metal center hexameric protein [Candidatus Micrarchaeota archaeon]|nr:Nif3-like dinuclear metal center hexameric protein [Candidatus Micrarchaeota archaeon]